jgi:diguanylate cyclase (GGDEF)-like protein
MAIDITTLFVLVALLCSVVGSILLWGGLRHDGGRIARNGGGGLFLIAFGLTLILLRGRIPDWTSTTLANAMMTLGFGFLWSVASLFVHDKVSVPAIFSGSLVWLAASAPPAFHADTALRMALISFIAAAYSTSGGWLLWQGRQHGRPARLALSILAFGHATLVAARGIVALFLPPMPSPFEGTWLQNVLMLEAPVTLIAGCFLAIGMMREQAESELRRNAEIDALTGVLNRRAFWGLAGERVKEAMRVKRPLILLLFDLDHFKSINDRFGHAIGDLILKLFAETAAQAIRVTDVFGRIGGEEFAALLPGCDAATGHQIAERIRADFSLRTATEFGAEATATVSIGIASNGADAADLDALMLRADAALYGSKRGGRDRVTDASVAERMPIIRVVSASR